MTREELNKKAVEKLKSAIETYEVETCEDCICREDALMCLTGEYIADKEYPPEKIISKHIKRIKALPSVKPARRTAQWTICTDEETGGEIIKCSKCGRSFGDSPSGFTNWVKCNLLFCPKCGADMQETERKSQADLTNHIMQRFMRKE